MDVRIVMRTTGAHMHARMWLFFLRARTRMWLGGVGGGAVVTELFSFPLSPLPPFFKKKRQPKCARTDATSLDVMFGTSFARSTQKWTSATWQAAPNAFWFWEVAQPKRDI